MSFKAFLNAPLRDRDDQAHVCFENGVVVLTNDRATTLVSSSTLPPYLFVWDKQVRPAVFNEESLEEGPHVHWWDFLQKLAQEKKQGKWAVNHEILQTDFRREMGCSESLVGFRRLLHPFAVGNGVANSEDFEKTFVLVR